MKSKIEKTSGKLSRILFPLIGALSVLLLFYLVRKVLIGDIPFWYDPARDLLSAWGNLSKPTLIGPTSGIPGVFYGPYWIWLLSFGMLFSPDPRIITFITAFIPYVVIFPGALLLSGVFERKNAFVIWILFLLSFNTYVVSLWNPNPAPLLFLIYLLLLYKMPFNRQKLTAYLLWVVCGFTLGILLNFHLSLGIGVLFGTGVYLLLTFARNLLRRKKSHIFSVLHFFLKIVLFVLGFVMAFGPFLVFEIRHQFIQTKTLLYTFSHYGGNIHLSGLTKAEIVTSFFQRAGILLHLPTIVAIVLLIAFGVYFFYQQKRREQFMDQDKKFLTIIFVLSLGVLFIYLTARNPVWSYHFIAVEILFFLFIGFLMEKIQFFRFVVYVWIFLLLLQFTFFLPRSFSTDPKALSGDLAAEIVVTKHIARDAGQERYTVYSYSPSIYMYDYAYLFHWLENKNFSYDPGKIERQGIVYLIFPPHVKQALSENFIHFHTPRAMYKTTNIWTISDGSIIIRRERL